ncbi:MAG: NAD-dependent epimerase/dehydratase family protein, partial [Myxococcota bacterium]
MRVLVTGATGFVGAAVVRRYLDEGHTVHVLARRPEAAQPLVERGARLHVGSVGDPNEVVAAARDAEVVVHAAAVASHRAAPAALAWVNVAGTENVLTAARHAGCRRLVHISCADVNLANQDRVQWNEDRQLDRSPLDAHGRSKRLAEDLVLSASGHAIETTALRPATLWGPGDTTTLPRLCREGLRGGIELAGGGGNLVSITYVDHLVDAVVAAAVADPAPGRVYQIADGEFLTSAEFYGALCRAAGLPPPRTRFTYALPYVLAALREWLRAPGPWRTEVIHRGRSIYLDHGRAIQELDCEPHVPFDEGMERTAAWVREVGGPEAVARLERK